MWHLLLKTCTKQYIWMTRNINCVPQTRAWWKTNTTSTGYLWRPVAQHTQPEFSASGKHQLKRGNPLDVEYYKVIEVHSAVLGNPPLMCSTCAQCPLRTRYYSHSARQSTSKVCSTWAQCPCRPHHYSDQTLVHCASQRWQVHGQLWFHFNSTIKP